MSERVPLELDSPGFQLVGVAGYLLLECHAVSGEASERGSWPLVKHRGKVSFMPATSLSSCWAARSAHFTAFPRHSKNSRGTRQSLLASSRPQQVLHLGCLVEDLPEKSELTLPTLVQYRYVHGSVLHKGHLRCVSMEGSGTALEAPSLEGMKQKSNKT